MRDNSESTYMLAIVNYKNKSVSPLEKRIKRKPMMELRKHQHLKMDRSMHQVVRKGSGQEVGQGIGKVQREGE